MGILSWLLLRLLCIGLNLLVCNSWVLTGKRPAAKKSVVLGQTESDDDNARSAFGTRSYWDDLYLGRGDFPAEEYSWYFGFEGYQNLVEEHIPIKESRILLPGIGNDLMLLDLIKKGYEHLTATDYSEHAIERQMDMLVYERYEGPSVELFTMDGREMDKNWTGRFDAIIEKGCLDAIYLSGDGNLELTAKEFERVLKPGGILLSVSGVVPEDLRRDVFSDWNWLRDGSSELKAGCFVLSRPNE